MMRTKRKKHSRQKTEETMIFGAGLLLAVLVFVFCLKCSGNSTGYACSTLSFQERDLFTRSERETQVDTNGFMRENAIEH